MYFLIQKCKKKHCIEKSDIRSNIFISCCYKLLLAKTLVHDSPVTTEKFIMMLPKIAYFFLMSSVFSIFTQPRSQEEVKFEKSKSKSSPRN